MTQTNEQMTERLKSILAHYYHAKELDPKFVDRLVPFESGLDNVSALRATARLCAAIRDENSSNGKSTVRDVFFAEWRELEAELAGHSWDRAKEEVYDCIAVLMRVLDEVETRKKAK